MSMEYLEGKFRTQGKGDLANIISAVHRLNGSDIPFPDAPASVPFQAAIVPPKEVFLPMSELYSKLDFAISEYKKGPLTPDLVKTTWQIIWETLGNSIRHTFKVPSCDRTSGELKQLQLENRAVLLIDDELYERPDLLKQIFPQTGNWLPSNVSTKERKGGCIDIEMTLHSPYRNIKKKQVMNILKRQDRTGQRLATYLVGSHFIYLQRDHYFDEEDTWSRLPGSTYDDRVAIVNHGSNGALHLGSDSGNPSNHYPNMGLRSEGRKKV